ncbi:MAG: TetR/AcrR family transcriptional regulator, partial [Actinobacteria bacterium]|nr:TetR/AcrR family transcriptional regulator [Actinomycetota bacterium]
MERNHKREPARRYDATRRREKAEASRQAVLTHTRRLFTRQGFGNTTVTQVASAAGVSDEFVYKNFGGKRGLVRAIYLESLVGVEDLPAEQRSDLAQMTFTDPHALMRRFGRFVTELSPLGMPVHLLIRDAAASGDIEMISLLEEVDDERYERMLHNARQVAARGFIRAGLSE